ncbi:hypothetical protein K439DRAFT_710968 [Ramaria rubella]|nr:hypothetical protein K439DRAFT_710968 [Ramaria rubella]
MSSPSPPPSPPPLTQAQLSEAGQNVLATKYYLAAAFTILLYDHMLSFSDELESIWKKSRAMITFVFLVNRYYTPAAMVAIMIGFFDNSWTPE